MSAPVLDRITFKTSRLAEFCSEKELINQTGHHSDCWPLVVLKEVLDNGLDACEESGVAPDIHITVSDDRIAVTDNGPGIAPDTVADILDYTSRVSSREAYVSLTRGAQGNALKTILAMGFALDGERGEPIIESRGRIGLGTLAVRQYVGSYANPLFEEAGFARATIETHGPKGRYGGLIYIEKEGFRPILERARLAEKLDVSIMSCKGMSVMAARTLIDKTCARYHIPLLILHDFDVSGFSIAKTLVPHARRFSFKSKFRTVDLGLRLTDIQELELGTEPVSFGNVSPSKIRERLKTNGATANEIAFLMEGQRVELNAMTSDQFVAFVERKLAKIVPPKDQLDEAYRLFAGRHHSRA